MKLRAVEGAALAALVATAADLALLWVANAGRPDWRGPLPPDGAVALGGVAGALAIPLYGAGFAALARAAGGAHARALAAGGVAAGVVGGAIHAATAGVIAGGAGAQGDPLAEVTRFGALLLPLWAAAALASLVASVAWTRLVRGGALPLPRALAWASPLALTLGFAALAAAAPPAARDFALPAAPNAAHLVFFTLVTATLARRRRAPGLVLARASSADAGDLAPLLRAFYEEEGYAFEPGTLASLAALLADPSLGRAWIARDDGRAVGYAVACFGWSLEHRGRDAFVDELYVAPSHRGRGLGRRLLERLEEECAALGVGVLHLEVEHGNDVGASLYASRGFGGGDRRLLSKRLSG